MRVPTRLCSVALGSHLLLSLSGCSNGANATSSSATGGTANSSGAPAAGSAGDAERATPGSSGAGATSQNSEGGVAPNVSPTSGEGGARSGDGGAGHGASETQDSLAGAAGAAPGAAGAGHSGGSGFAAGGDDGVIAAGGDGGADGTAFVAGGAGGESTDDGVDSCASNPCHNGASCQDLPAGFTCTCAPGFGGDTCEDDYCAQLGCENGGTCTRHDGGAECDCAPGFGGETCEDDYCAQLSCENGGTCARLDGGAECDCPDDFAGDNCERYEPEWQAVGTSAITQAEMPSLDVDDTVPYFAYRDRETSSTGMTVRRLEGDEWVVVGSAGFSWTHSRLTAGPNLAVENGVALVAHEGNNLTAIRNRMQFFYFAGEDWYPTTFYDYASFNDVQSVWDLAYCDGVAYVSLYNYDSHSSYTWGGGEGWDGGPEDWYGLEGSGSLPGNPELACEGDAVYRASIYDDSTGHGRAQIEQYDAATNTWSFVVAPDFHRIASLDTLNVDVAVDHGQVYFLTSEGELLADTPQPSVFRLEGGEWVSVGAPIFTHEMSWTGSGAQLLVHDGTPVVGLVDHSGRPVIWYFDGSVWAQLGAPGSLLAGVSTPSSYYSMGVGTDGTVWVVLVDDGRSNTVVVKRLSLP